MPDLILLDMKNAACQRLGVRRTLRCSVSVVTNRAPVVVVTAAEHAAVRARDIAAAGYPRSRSRIWSYSTEVRAALNRRSVVVGSHTVNVLPAPSRLSKRMAPS